MTWDALDGRYVLVWFMYIGTERCSVLNRSRVGSNPVETLSRPCMMLASCTGLFAILHAQGFNLLIQLDSLTSRYQKYSGKLVVRTQPPTQSKDRDWACNRLDQDGSGRPVVSGNPVRHICMQVGCQSLS